MRIMFNMCTLSPTPSVGTRTLLTLGRHDLLKDSGSQKCINVKRVIHLERAILENLKDVKR